MGFREARSFRSRPVEAVELPVGGLAFGACNLLQLSSMPSWTGKITVKVFNLLIQFK
jgi:hypothetical protein